MINLRDSNQGTTGWEFIEITDSTTWHPSCPTCNAFLGATYNYCPYCGTKLITETEPILTDTLQDILNELKNINKTLKLILKHN